MIVRRNLRLRVVLRYGWKVLATSTLAALALAYAYHVLGWQHLRIPFSAVGALSTALAIFLAFRNNTSYDRWWEARKLWGQLINSSRSFARQVTTLLTVPAGGALSSEELRGVQRELVHRQIAFAHALRFHLRKQPQLLDEISALLSREELARAKTSRNVPAYLLQRQGERLAELSRQGLMNHHVLLALDRTLTELANVQGGCERIKNTPLPRQYDFYPRVFVYLYTVFLPFGLVAEMGWLTPVVSVPISFLFKALEGVGAVNEDPFENRIQDTPLTALCRTIEVNLREVLGETDLPPALEPVDGYLF
ncbi:MAG: bestrophin family ion channel [Myxococcota bacterium]